MFHVRVKQVPAQRYSSRTRNVLVDKLEAFILDSIREPAREVYLSGPGEPLRMEIAWQLR